MASSSLPPDPQSTTFRSPSSAAVYASLPANSAVEIVSATVRFSQKDLIPPAALPPSVRYPAPFFTAQSLSNRTRTPSPSPAAATKIQDPSQGDPQARCFPVTNTRQRIPDHSLLLAKIGGGFPPHPPPFSISSQLRLLGFSHVDPSVTPSHHPKLPDNIHRSLQASARPPHMAPPTTTTKRGSSELDCNGCKEPRDGSSHEDHDPTAIMIRDRKILFRRGASLYSRCRSWLRNGHTVDNQPQPIHVIKPHDFRSFTDQRNGKREREDHQDIEVEEGVEALSTRDLLQKHVSRAKRIRTRKREERLQRISKYRSRLHSLLHPPVGQT